MVWPLKFWFKSRGRGPKGFAWGLSPPDKCTKSRSLKKKHIPLSFKKLGRNKTRETQWLWWALGSASACHSWGISWTPSWPLQLPCWRIVNSKAHFSDLLKRESFEYTIVTALHRWWVKFCFISRSNRVAPFICLWSVSVCVPVCLSDCVSLSLSLPDSGPFYLWLWLRFWLPFPQDSQSSVNELICQQRKQNSDLLTNDINCRSTAVLSCSHVALHDKQNFVPTKQWRGHLWSMFKDEPFPRHTNRSLRFLKFVKENNSLYWRRVQIKYLGAKCSSPHTIHKPTACSSANTCHYTTSAISSNMKSKSATVHSLASNCTPHVCRHFTCGISQLFHSSVFNMWRKNSCCALVHSVTHIERWFVQYLWHKLSKTTAEHLPWHKTSEEECQRIMRTRGEKSVSHSDE